MVGTKTRVTGKVAPALKMTRLRFLSTFVRDLDDAAILHKRSPAPWMGRNGLEVFWVGYSYV